MHKAIFVGIWNCWRRIDSALLVWCLMVVPWRGDVGLLWQVYWRENYESVDAVLLCLFLIWRSAMDLFSFYEYYGWIFKEVELTNWMIENIFPPGNTQYIVINDIEWIGQLGKAISSFLVTLFVCFVISLNDASYVKRLCILCLSIFFFFLQFSICLCMPLWQVKPYFICLILLKLPVAIKLEWGFVLFLVVLLFAAFSCLLASFIVHLCKCFFSITSFYFSVREKNTFLWWKIWLSWVRTNYEMAFVGSIALQLQYPHCERVLR